MKISKKGIVAIALTIAILASVVTYSLLTVVVPVTNHIKILGGSLDLWKRNTNGENYSFQYTTDDFDGHLTGDVVTSPELVLVSDAANTVNYVLTFNSTLPSSVGTIIWQLEVYWGSNPMDYRWINWTTSLLQPGPSTTMYLPGTPGNPMRPGTKLGLRPATPDIGMTGHFRYILVVSTTAPCGDYPFGMSITGTQA
jgi:hypothetical protein